MTSALRHTKTKFFLASMLAVVFLCVSIWHSSHVHHQHGPEDASLISGQISFGSGIADGHGGEAESHGAHSHEAPDKTAHLHKPNTSWKALRGKADGDNQLKMPAVFSARDVVTLTPETGTIQTPHVMVDSGAWAGGRPSARAPPFIFSFA